MNKGIMGVCKETAMFDAKRECRRFLDSVEKALIIHKEIEPCSGRSKEMAAVTRASLDLSAALVRFRKAPVGF